MEITNFNDLINATKNLKKRKRISVACADDSDVLKAVKKATDEGLADAVLVGNAESIAEVAKSNSISLDDYEVIDVKEPSQAVAKCCELVRNGEASVVMKGLLDTSVFMKGLLDKEKGINDNKLISHVALFEMPTYPKILTLTDAAVNINPTLNEKASIIGNAVSVVKSLGIENPLVACACAIEKVNAKAMSDTVDAALLAKMNDRGQIKGCVVDGPLGFDNAISPESAETKKIVSPVAGKADIILAPDLLSANFLYKSMIYLAKAKSAAVLAGTKAPVVLTSRADSHETKYYSIALGLLSAE